MALHHVQLYEKIISCSICLDLLKDPVTTSCGHNYCTKCIKGHWDGEDEKKIYSCPLCRQTFTPRPVLMKNTMLADLVEQLKKTGLRAAPADHCYAGVEDVSCDVCTGRKLKASKSCLMCLVSYCEKHLQLHYESPAFEIHKLVMPSKNLQVCHTDVGHDNVSATAERTERKRELEGSRLYIQQRIQDRQKDVKLLSHNEDHNQFLLNYTSLAPLSPSTSSINIRPRRYFEDVTAAASEPKTRAEFLKYSQQISLDPNTAYKELVLSEGNRRVTVTDQHQSYPRHPDRFTGWSQVLSRESLTGRCYWEVEWRGRVDVAVSYKSIRRDGVSKNRWFGFNNKSWMLNCDLKRFWYNSIRTDVSGPPSSRVGVYLDHDAGILSIYSVSETMALLHRVQTTFTEPLHAGLHLYPHFYGTSAEICKLK